MKNQRTCASKGSGQWPDCITQRSFFPESVRSFFSKAEELALAEGIVETDTEAQERYLDSAVLEWETEIEQAKQIGMLIDKRPTPDRNLAHILSSHGSRLTLGS